MKQDTKSYVLAIGIFDGVHRGHQAIFKKAIKESRRLGATPGVLTFSTHPSRVIDPRHPVPLLQTFDQRCEEIHRQGIQKVFPLHFTQRLSKLSPSEFVDQVLFRHWKLRGVVVGKDFRFGHRRIGGVKELRELLASRGARVWAVDPVKTGGRVIQSTVIRRHLAAGQLDKARSMLGHPFELTGSVTRGAGLGSKLGARTVNLRLGNELLPAFGVYAGRLRKSSGRAIPARRPVVMNLGVAPTLHRSRPPLLEVHVLDGQAVRTKSGEKFSADLVKYLRAERKFSSVTALRHAIQTDVRRAQSIVGGVDRRSARSE